MGKLIVNADDFGFSRGVNLGIVEGFREGVLTSTTMMCGMPGFDQAVKMAKDNKNLAVGVHLTLTAGNPIRKDLKTIVDSSGKFKGINTYMMENFEEEIDPEEIKKERMSQIDKLIDAGINPSHLDSHHYVQNAGNIKEIFFELARKYDLPVRYTLNTPNDIKSPEKLIEYFDVIGKTKGIWKDMHLDNLIKDCITYDVIETACHPGYVDNFILENSSYNTVRAVALKEVKDKNFVKVIEENEIELISFRDL